MFLAHGNHFLSQKEKYQGLSCAVPVDFLKNRGPRGTSDPVRVVIDLQALS